MTTALLVDDQEDIRVLVTFVLKQADIACVAAATGEEAIPMLEADPGPDVVLLDVQMPDSDGWEVLERIRSSPTAADLPVIMTTVKAHPRDEARAWDLGCDGYVTKPFDLDALVALIREVLTRSPRERDRLRRVGSAQARARLHRT